MVSSRFVSGFSESDLKAKIFIMSFRQEDCYIYIIPQKQGKVKYKKFEKFRKNFKKVLDKITKAWYNIVTIKAKVKNLKNKNSGGNKNEKYS